MIEKKYDPSEAERRIYDMWESKGLFKPTDTDSKNFSIVMPPPNVTGSLHMGHALNTTLQDIIVRYQRMKGKNVLWQPGTDHAGIATQMVVERNLLSEKNISRRELGRESFVNEIWRWKKKSGGTMGGGISRDHLRLSGDGRSQQRLLGRYLVIALLRLSCRHPAK